jgi:hypothetical protein
VFKNIELYDDPLLWPFIEISITDNSSIFSSETLYVTIPIIDFAQDLISEKQYIYSKA